MWGVQNFCYHRLKSAQSAKVVVLFWRYILYDHISSCKESIIRGDDHNEHG